MTTDGFKTHGAGLRSENFYLVLAQFICELRATKVNFRHGDTETRRQIKGLSDPFICLRVSVAKFPARDRPRRAADHWAEEDFTS
jgi:hypothetical protein